MPHKFFKIVFLSLSLLIATATYVVSSENDSIVKLLATNIPDTSKVKFLNALSKNYFNDNPDTSVTIAASAKALAEKLIISPAWHFH